MKIGEVLNEVFDADVGWRPSSGAIKPVHVANGLIRELQGAVYDVRDLHEFVVWFQWKGSPVYEVPTEVDPAAPDYAAEWLDYAAPDSLVAGQPGIAYVEVRNVGSQPWPEAGDEAVRLGCRWLDAEGQEVPVSEAGTWPMPRTIEPGSLAIFRDVEYLAPDTPGAYRLVWDLMQAGIWLSSQGLAVKEQAVQVVADSAADGYRDFSVGERKYRFDGNKYVPVSR